MADESKGNARLEIGHVLFLDIVGYSKLLTEEQTEALQELNRIVLATEAARTAETGGQLIRLPTGDGMALVFTNSVEDPVECALQISQALRAQPSLPVRMGIHSGPVHQVADVNQRQNVAGAGINLAQRVMDCGDANHILVSKRVADDLVQYRRWQPYLHDLGDCEVKHGARISVVNLYTDDLGNPVLPSKLRCKTEPPIRSASRWPLLATTVVVLLSLGYALWWLVTRPARPGAPAAAVASEPVVPEKSIAVLPFENLSEEKANAFFADGVQDEILTDLAKIADLKVISRTSVMQYRTGVMRNLREIGRQLGVAHLLEGSVQRSGGKVRVNAQLIDARNDAHLWAQTYDRDLADVFAIQSEIAQTIAEQLQAHLSPRERADIAKPVTTDLVANELYVRARKLKDNPNDPLANADLLQAVSLLEEAVRRDPSFLLAYCLLSETHVDLYWGGFDHTETRRDLARVALEQAERLQPDAGEVHLQKAIYAYHGFRDFEKALAELEIARRLLPNSSKAYLMTAAIDRRLGRFDEALQNFDQAVELDPLNFESVEEAAFTREALRRYDAAKRWLERALALAPKDYTVRTDLATLPFWEHANTRPWRTQLNQIMAEGHDAASHAALSFFYCALAERDRAAATQALTLVPVEGTVNPYDNSLLPRDWLVGLVARVFGEQKAAREAFTRCRPAAAVLAQAQPEYASAWSMLGLIDAGLGEKSKAIEEGKRACNLRPITQDAFEGAFYVTNLAQIYAWVGEKNLARETLASSVKDPVGVTYGELKLSPVWDPLRGDPRFEQIVASLAPK